MQLWARRRVLAKDGRVSSKEITAARPWGTPHSGLIDDLLMPTYYSGVLQRSSPKNYVMHPVRPNQLSNSQRSLASRLFLSEILEAVKDAPPLQVEAVGERFKGITVRWNAQVYTREEYQRKGAANLHSPEKPGLIFCEVLLSQYKELGYT